MWGFTHIINSGEETPEAKAKENFGPNSLGKSFHIFKPVGLHPTQLSYILLFLSSLLRATRMWDKGEGR